MVGVRERQGGNKEVASVVQVGSQRGSPTCGKCGGKVRMTAKDIGGGVDIGL